MTAYYNEIDPYAAQWLRNLIYAGLIAQGDVDERSIVDLRASDLRRYTQCHFFAGIGGWSIALRLAGWPDHRPVWTGSCPCQPFSAAGAGKAADDGRHLWPAWFSLIAECRPAIVYGEQVEAAIGWGWLDAVFSDLEGQGYACGAAVLPACGVGAPHIRNRLWFLGNTEGDNGRCEQSERGPRSRRAGLAGAGAAVVMADAGSGGVRRRYEHGSDIGKARQVPGKIQEQRFWTDNGSDGSTGNVADADGGDASTEGLQRSGEHRQRAQDGCASFWSDAEWIDCTDGKSRPVGPGSFPLAHGIQRRTSKLRAYGNAIVPQVAAQFIGASMMEKADG